MAGDVAQLGLAVDSSQVTAATAALKGFGPAAQGAAKGATEFNQATVAAESRTRAIQSAADRAGVSFKEMEARVKASSSAVSGASTGMSQYSQQAQKVEQANIKAVKAANDNTIAVNNLGRAANDNNTAFDRLANTITRRFLAALAVAALKDFAQYIWNLNAAIAATAQTAELAGVSLQKFQGLTTAAGYKGVSTDAFNSAMIEFNKQTDLAKIGVGSLRSLLSANGQTVSDTATNFGKVADLVAATADGARKLSILQQAGLPATKEFASLLSQGSAAINKVADASSKLTNQQMEDAKRLNDRWNELYTNIENRIKRIVVNTANAFSGLATGGQSDPDRPRVLITQPSAKSGSAAPPFDPELEKQRLAAINATIAALGNLATVDQQATARENELKIARLNNANVSTTQVAILKEQARQQALGVYQVNSQTDSEKVRYEALFKSNEAATAYVIVQNKINEAIQAGRPLTEAQVAELQKSAEAFAAAKKKADEYTQIFDALKSGAASFGSDLVSNLRNGESAMAALGHAAQNLSTQLTSGAINSLLQGNFVAAAAQGIGAIISGIFGNNQKKRDEEEKAAKAAMDRIAAYSERAQLAGLDTSTRAGALAAFDVQANSQRQQEAANGNRAIVQLEQALAAERQAIVDRFNKQDLDAAQAAADAKAKAEQEALDASLARMQTYRDRLQAASADTSTLSGALADFEYKAAQERAAEVQAGGQALNDLIAAQESERYNIYKKFNEASLDAAKKTAEELQSFVNGVVKNITAYLQGLKTGSNSILSPQDQLAAAQSNFNAQLSLAQGGNRDALSGITNVAQTLLDQAKNFYASSGGYTTIYEQVTAALQGLTGVSTGTVASADAQAIVDAVHGTTGAVNTTGASNDNLTEAQNALQAAQNALAAQQTSYLQTQVNLLGAINSLADRFVAAINGMGQITAAIGNTATTQSNVQISLLSQIANKPQQSSGTLWSWLGFQNGGQIPGYADGGVVGNGVYGVDSVRARYAGGGDIALAGGEFVTRAPSVNASTLPVLNFINDTGRAPGNDNGQYFAALARTNAAGFSAVVSAIRDLESAVYGGAKMQTDAMKQRPAERPGKKSAA